MCFAFRLAARQHGKLELASFWENVSGFVGFFGFKGFFKVGPTYRRKIMKGCCGERAQNRGFLYVLVAQNAV